MGRSLKYLFLNKYDIERYESDELEINWEDHFCSGHEKINHNLPYEKIYSKETLLEDLHNFINSDEYYEASVICKILSEIGNSEFCYFRYD